MNRKKLRLLGRMHITTLLPVEVQGLGAGPGLANTQFQNPSGFLGSGLCVTMLSVQMLVKSQSCISSILLLFLSWMQFALYHHTLVLLKMKVMSTSPLLKSCIAIVLHNFLLPHELKSPDCSQSVEKDKSMFDWCFFLSIYPMWTEEPFFNISNDTISAD